MELDKHQWFEFNAISHSARKSTTMTDSRFHPPRSLVLGLRILGLRILGLRILGLRILGLRIQISPRLTMLDLPHRERNLSVISGSPR
jgi:hypothetical protein